MARIHGSKGSVAMDAAGGTTYVALADLSKWSLNMTRDRVPVTAFGDTNVVRVQGLPDFSGALSGFWSSATSPTLFAVVLGSTAVGLKLIPSTLEPTYFFSGLAYIDGGVDVDVNGAVTFTGSWVAAANWTMAP